jgi:hypothetical protein
MDRRIISVSPSPKLSAVRGCARHQGNGHVAGSPNGSRRATVTAGAPVNSWSWSRSRSSPLSRYGARCVLSGRPAGRHPDIAGTRTPCMLGRAGVRAPWMPVRAAFARSSQRGSCLLGKNEQGGAAERHPAHDRLRLGARLWMARAIGRDPPTAPTAALHQHQPRLHRVKHRAAGRPALDSAIRATAPRSGRNSAAWTGLEARPLCRSTSAPVFEEGGLLAGSDCG